jgi:hypothetical protein
MKVPTSEDLGTAVVPAQPALYTIGIDCSPAGRLHDKPDLSPEQDAFIRDRFSTKLEDPRTGRRIRS